MKKNKKFPIKPFIILIALLFIGLLTRMSFAVFAPQIIDTGNYEDQGETQLYIESGGEETNYKIISLEGELIEEGDGGSLGSGGPDWYDEMSTNFSEKGKFFVLRKGSELVRTPLPIDVNSKQISVYNPIDENKVLVGFGDGTFPYVETKHVYIFDIEQETFSEEIRTKASEYLPIGTSEELRLMTVDTWMDQYSEVDFENNYYKDYQFTFYSKGILHRVRYDVVNEEGEYLGENGDPNLINITEGKELYTGEEQSDAFTVVNNLATTFASIYAFPIFAFFDQNIDVLQTNNVLINIDFLEAQETDEKYNLELNESLVGVNKLKIRNEETNESKTLVSWLGFKEQYPVVWRQLSNGDFIVVVNDEVAVVDSEKGTITKITEFSNYIRPGAYKVIVM